MLLVSIIFFTSLAQAKIEVCYRKANIAFGLVNHYWLRTDLKEAGMGSGRVQGQIGDQFEGPGTKVYVIDHTDQVPEVCEETTNHDEECINSELEEGRYLGRFTPVNNCQTFVRSVLKRCETPEYREFKKERAEYRRLKRKIADRVYLSKKQKARLDELKVKFEG